MYHVKLFKQGGGSRMAISPTSDRSFDGASPETFAVWTLNKSETGDSRCTVASGCVAPGERKRRKIAAFALTCRARRSTVSAMECRSPHPSGSRWRPRPTTPAFSTGPPRCPPSLRIPPRPCSKRRCKQRYVKNHVMIATTAAADDCDDNRWRLSTGEKKYIADTAADAIEYGMSARRLTRALNMKLHCASGLKNVRFLQSLSNATSAYEAAQFSWSYH